jgi:hypothetical protein
MWQSGSEQSVVEWCRGRGLRFSHSAPDAAKAAADTENTSAGHDVDKPGEILHELNLGPYLGFIAAHPIAVVKMLVQAGAVVWLAIS